MPSATNAVQFRLYTNASPEAAHLFNTFDIEAYGAVVLQGPEGSDLRRWLASPTNALLHNLLVNGQGADLATTNAAQLIEQAAGPEWSFLAVDVSTAYRGRLKQFRRGILFVEPDLFVIYDHLVADKPADIDFVIHPPAATMVDKDWGDLRLKLPAAGMQVNTPSPKKALRVWEAVESAADNLLPGTVTMQIGPGAKLTELNLITVFAVYPSGQPQNYQFKLLESDSAIGARIMRRNLPTLVAFKTLASASSASLTGFAFKGPVGVGVFKPKRKVP